jgi:hypothetical protein
MTDKHPLEMNKKERKSRRSKIVTRLEEIETELAATGGVNPALENEWSQLDTERRKIEEIGI